MTGGELVWRTVHWPRPLAWQHACELVCRLAADASLGRLAVQTSATARQIAFQIGATAGQIDQLAAIVGELVPGARLTASPQAGLPADRRRPTAAGRIGLRQPNLALTTARAEAVARAILASLCGLDDGEMLVLQLLIGSRLPPRLVDDRAPSARQNWWRLLTGGVQPARGEELAAIRQRRSQHGALAHLRLGAMASCHQRAAALLQRLFGALKTSEAAGARLRLHWEHPAALWRARRPWQYRLNLSAAEIACLAGWPIGQGELPGLPPVSPRLLAPPPWLAGHRRSLARRQFARTRAGGPNDDGLPLGIPAADALLHTVLVGPTGSGKSTALQHLILADARAGRSVVVIDPKRDLVTDILERLPAERADDVVVIDPTSPTPVGFNPLAGPDRPEVTVDGVLAAFKALFADSWGVRTEEVLTASLLTLARQGGPAATLVAIPALLTNPAFRRQMTAGLDDPLGVSAFWAKYEAISPQQQAQIIAPVLNKLQQLVIRPQLRAVLGQARPRFAIADIFNRRRIILVALNKGIIGAASARLLGSLLLGSLWPRILARAGLPPAQRHLVSVYIDEVHDFIAGIPGDLADALAQARSLGVAFHLAHQYRAQLSPAMRAAIDANVRNTVCFGLSAADAHEMAHRADSLEPADFLSLARFDAYCATWCAGRQTGWLSAATLPPSSARRSAAELTAASAARYGTPAQQTEQQLRSVIWGEPTTHGTHEHSAPAGDRAQFGRKPTRTHHTDTDAPDDPSPH